MFPLAKKAQPINQLLKTSVALTIAVYLRLLPIMLVNAALVLLSQYLWHWLQPEDLGVGELNLTGRVLSVSLFSITSFLCALAMRMTDNYIKGEAQSLVWVLVSVGKKLIGIIIGALFFYALLYGAFNAISFIPCLFLLILLSMYLPAMVLEDKSLWQALGYSGRLVWRHWLRVFVVISLAFMIPIVLYITGGLLMKYNDARIAVLFNFFVYMVVSPFLVAEWVILFYDLQQRQCPR